MEKCSKCNGTGNYLNYGSCWSCGGTGKNKYQKTKIVYKIGDRIQHKKTKKIYEVVAINRSGYVCKKYASDGVTLLSDLPTKLGKHICNYSTDSNEGYIKLNSVGE